jgi:hypothetical protein
VLNRRLATSLIALGLAGLAVAGCADQAAAVRVNDRTMSRSDFEEHLDAIYDDDDLRDYWIAADRESLRPQDAPEGTYTQQYVGEVARLHVLFLALEEVLDDEGIELTDDDRAAARAEIAEFLGVEPDELEAARWDDYVDAVAGIRRLSEDLGEEEADAAVSRVLTEGDVSVSSQYGSWDPDTFRVTPPPGPRDGGGTRSFVG